MDRRRVVELLEAVRAGETSIDEAAKALSNLPFADLGFARVDTHRDLRVGSPEVIFCQGKRPDEVREIAIRILDSGGRLLATRADADAAAAIRAVAPDAEVNDRARTVTVLRDPLEPRGKVAIVCAGTADLPVAEEARVTAEALGARTDRMYDCGVAGIHRLLGERDRLLDANALVVVAGMEGALPSVVGGLVGRPIFAVPTSVGYGAGLGGIAPLLTMLNSCAAGVSVLNIDNGFGGGYAAALVNRLVAEARDAAGSESGGGE